MLEGLRSNEIVVGAYSHDGGICPMLAAHRGGGRTNLISFARAWDRFASAKTGGNRPRRATRRELLVLRTHLEASLLDDDGPAPELAAAIREHRELVARREPRELAAIREHRELAARRAKRERAGVPENRHPGWSWMRLVRRYDDYLATLDALQEAAGERLEHGQERVVADRPSRERTILPV
jgi:hypothetical protein